MMTKRPMSLPPMSELPGTSPQADAASRGELVFFNLDRLTSGLLRHWMPGRRCHVALDVADLSRVLDRNFGLVVVVGVGPPGKRLGELVQWTTARINHPNRPCIFAVRDVKLAVPDHVFQQTGFAAVFSVGWPSRQMVEQADRHWRSLVWPPENVVTRFRRMIPF